MYMYVILMCIVMLPVQYTVWRVRNLCGLVGDSFGTHSGKDAIKQIIDQHEVNGTGDEWNYMDEVPRLVFIHFQ